MDVKYIEAVTKHGDELLSVLLTDVEIINFLVGFE